MKYLFVCILKSLDKKKKEKKYYYKPIPAAKTLFKVALVIDFRSQALIVAVLESRN